jgi:hypothetical protein
MVVVDVLVFAAGVALVLFAVSSAVRTMVVPRGIPTIIARAVFVGVRRVFSLLIPRKADYHRRDRVMAYYAPVSLLVLPIVWLCIVGTGFTLMYWALEVDNGSVRDAVRLSGSSMLTLGFANATGLPTQALVFSEAASGIGLIALVISYLPLLNTTFSRREAAVALLESRAGGARSRFGHGPSGAEMLWRFHRIGWRGGLHEVWVAWEAWFIDVEESHTSIPALPFFRSPQPDRSWITAAGAVLDAAALRLSTVDEDDDPEAALTIRAGYVALRRVADFFAIPYDADPTRGDPIAVSREEWDEACAYLEEGGVPVKADRDEAYLDFAGWRVNYETVLLALCGLTMAPPAVWSGDRARRP